MSPRTGVLTIGMLSLALLPALPVLGAEGIGGAAPAATAPAGLPETVQVALSKGDYQAVQAGLLDALKGKTITPDDPQVLRLCTLLEFVRVTDPAVLTNFARVEAQRRFLESFAQDAAWQELYLGCGLVPFRTDVGISVLFRIWEAESGQVKNKKLAVALASVWGGGETAPSPAVLKKDPARYNPVWRYRFFQEQAARGLLQPGYERLRPWELRFTVGIPGQDWDDESFRYAADHINLPWDQYQNACWSAIYTDPSKFGDSVQGGLYNYPFSDESNAETTHRNGGVCGALSHLGCYAAMAHGIPAYTVGQPGHCAYGVRPERGKWVGGFGGPDGGMHNHIFGEKAPTSYLLMESVFADDATIDKAYRQSLCARALEALGDSAAAIAMWKQALATSPLHPFFRRELHRLLMAGGLTPDACFSYLMETIPAYRGNGFAAVDMAADLEPLVSRMSDEQKRKLYSRMHEMIACTQSSWATRCDDIIARQSASLSDAAQREAYLADVLTTHMNTGDGTVFGQILEWAVKEYVQSGREDIFTRSFARAADSAPVSSQEGADEGKRKKMREAYGKAIAAAEQARSSAAFLSLTKAAEAVCGDCGVASPVVGAQHLPGKPAEAALFRPSTTSTWDAPAYHHRVTTLEGGRCHSDKENRPFFIVELRKPGRLAGCLIRKADGNEYRMTKAVVYTSADGATWMKRAEIENMTKEWVVVFSDGTEGKWVKVEFDNGDRKEFAHLSHFVIYTR